MHRVKSIYKGKAVLLGGGPTFVFPEDGSNPYNEKTCKRYPQYFECTPDPKSTGRGKAHDTKDVERDSGASRPALDKVGGEEFVSAEVNGSIPELKDVKGSAKSKSKPSSSRVKNGKSKPPKEDR